MTVQNAARRSTKDRDDTKKHMAECLEWGLYLNKRIESAGLPHLQRDFINSVVDSVYDIADRERAADKVNWDARLRNPEETSGLILATAAFLQEAIKRKYDTDVEEENVLSLAMNIAEDVAKTLDSDYTNWNLKGAFSEERLDIVKNDPRSEQPIADAKKMFTKRFFEPVLRNF